MTTSRTSEDRLSAANAAIFSQIELLERLRSTSIDTGKAISDAFAKGVVAGNRFDQTLNDIGKRLSGGLLRAALKPAEQAIGQLVSGTARALFGQLNPIGAGLDLGRGIGSLAGVTAFAQGGVINEPTFFGAGRNLGLMGERGAEAILPLARGPDGRLGVSAGAGGGATVTVNIAASDVESFRRSEGQIAAAIARAVARGNRGL